MAHYTNPKSSFSPWLAVIAAAVAIVIYFSVIDNALLFEGQRLTAENPQIDAKTPISRLWTAPTPDIEGSTHYQPALATLLRLERRGWGMSPSSFHAISLILLVVLLVAAQLWATRLTKRLGVTAFVVIGLAVHPMTGQAVRTIAGQGLLLALIAIFLAMFAMHLWRDGKLNLPWAIAVLAALAFVAYGSHEIGLLLPVWLGIQWLALKTVPIPPPAVTRQKKKTVPAEPRVIGSKDLLWLLAPVGGALIVYLILRGIALGSIVPAGGGGGFGHFVSAAALAVKRLFWPVHPTVVYSLDHDAGFLPPAIVGCIAIAVLAGLIFWLWQSQRMAAAGLALALSAIAAIGMGLALTGRFSEAPLLFVIPGFALALGIAYREVQLPFKQVVAIVALPLGVMSWNAGKAWHDAETLWNAEAALHPANAYPLLQLFQEYVRVPRVDKALETVNRVRPLLKRADDKERVVELEAGLYAASNRVKDLDRVLGDEIAAGGDHSAGHMLRLAALARLKNLSERNAGLIQSELDKYPDSYEALHEMAGIELRRRNFDRAIELEQKAIQSAKGDKARAAAITRYGIILGHAGMLQQSASQLMTSLKSDPTQYEAYVYLARVLRDMKKYDDSRKVILDCLRNVQVASYADLAKVFVSTLEAQDKYDEAADWLSNLIQQHPNDFELNLFAAHFMVEVNRFEDARKLVNKLGPSAKGRGLVELWNIAAMISFFGDKDYAQAERLTKQVLKAVPGHPEATLLLPKIEAARRARKPS